MRTVIKADERNGVQVTTQRLLLAAQEFVQPQHPLVGLRLKEGLGQARHQLCRRNLVDVEFAHQVLADLGSLVLSDVAGQPSSDLRTEQRRHLFRAEQLAQLLRSRQLGLLGSDMTVIERRKQLLVLKRLPDGIEHRREPRIFRELLVVKRQAAQRSDIQHRLVSHPAHRLYQQAGRFLDQMLIPRIAGRDVVAAWRGTVRPCTRKPRWLSTTVGKNTTSGDLASGCSPAVWGVLHRKQREGDFYPSDLLPLGRKHVAVEHQPILIDFGFAGFLANHGYAMDVVAKRLGSVAQVEP